jgi:hypothetical protein
LLPADGFIEPAHDRTLLRDARRRISRFAFVEAIENSAFQARLESWLGCAVPADRMNETTTMPMPDELRSALHVELTSDARRLLQERSRLDLELWRDVLRAAGLPPSGIAKLRANTQERTLARYTQLMAPGHTALAAAAD